MSSKSLRIFRPWDAEESAKQDEKKMVEESKMTEMDWRVPPTEWCEAFENYWTYMTRNGVLVAQVNPKVKQRPKRFRCPYCDVAFSNNGQLKGHVRIHTGERPFRCDAENCGKSFTRNEELTRHKRIHSGVRPYPCSQCGKTFGRKDHLKKHARTHMPQYSEIPPQYYVYPYLYGY